MRWRRRRRRRRNSRWKWWRKETVNCLQMRIRML